MTELKKQTTCDVIHSTSWISERGKKSYKAVRSFRGVPAKPTNGVSHWIHWPGEKIDGTLTNP